MNNEFQLKKYNEFMESSVHKSLKETSLDDSKTPYQYMTMNQNRVIDFDEVKKNYLKSINLLETDAKSVDALYMLKNKLLCMTEFKNGDFTNSEIVEKALSSALIFCDITNQKLSYLRENAVFILVYNGDIKKPGSRNRAAYEKSHRAKVFYSSFKLDHLYGFCFKDVIEIEKDDFSSSKYCNDLLPY